WAQYALALRSIARDKLPQPGPEPTPSGSTRALTGYFFGLGLGTTPDTAVASDAMLECFDTADAGHMPGTSALSSRPCLARRCFALHCAAGRRPLGRSECGQQDCCGTGRIHRGPRVRPKRPREINRHKLREPTLRNPSSTLCEPARAQQCTRRLYPVWTDRYRDSTDRTRHATTYGRTRG
ncbi:hypothetical protein CCUS01_03518, partial [Colletotrichum cuscutae]